METPYFQSVNKDFILYKDDTVQRLQQIDSKVDMIFADPPYFLSSGENCVFNGTPITFDKGQWEYYNEKYKPLRNKLASEFKKLCPKPIENKEV